MQHLSSMDRARNALERGDRFPVASLPKAGRDAVRSASIHDRNRATTS